MSRPLSMSARTVIVSVARPGAMAVTCMPSALDARSLANIPSRTCSAICWASDIRRSFRSAVGEARAALVEEGLHAFAVVVREAELALDAGLHRQRARVVHLRGGVDRLARGDERARGHGGQALRERI